MKRGPQEISFEKSILKREKSNGVNMKMEECMGWGGQRKL